MGDVVGAAREALDGAASAASDFFAVDPAVGATGAAGAGVVAAMGAPMSGAG